MLAAADNAAHATRPSGGGVVAFLLLAWLALVVHTAWFVVEHGSPMPSRDDLELVPLFAPGTTPGAILNEVWSPLNEHRLPLAQLVHFAAVSIARDFRAGGYVQVGLLAATALAGLAAARRLRGRSAPEDVLFPLLLLHWSQAENLLLGTQVCVALALFLATLAGCAVVWTPGAPSARRIAVVGACTLLLPLCGGFGLCPSPAFAAWIAIAGLGALRAGERGRALGAAAWCAAYGACVALYFTDYALPAAPSLEHRVDVGAGIVVQVLSMAFGAEGAYHPWIAIPAALALVGLTVAGIRRGASGPPDERWRALGLATIPMGVLLLAGAIGWARQADWPYSGWAGRYSSTSAPLVFAAVFATLCYGGRVIARAVPITLALLSAAALPFHVERGEWAAAELDAQLRPFLIAVRAEPPIDELARTWAGPIYPDATGFRAKLAILRETRLPPFDRDANPPHVDDRALVVPPVVASSAAAPVERRLGGLDLVAVLAPARLEVELACGARAAALRFCVPPVAYLDDAPPERRTLGVRLRAVQERDGAPPIELFRRLLQPGEFRSERGLQTLAVELAPGGGRLVLEVEGLSSDHPGTDWLGVSRLEVR